MDWQAVCVFLAAFFTEVFGASYVIAISRNSVQWAIVFHLSNTSLSHLAWWLAIGDRDLVLFSWLGESIGGVLVLYVSESKTGWLHTLTRKGHVRFTAYLDSVFGRGKMAKRKQKPRAKPVKALKEIDDSI